MQLRSVRCDYFISYFKYFKGFIRHFNIRMPPDGRVRIYDYISIYYRYKPRPHKKI